MTKGNSPPAWHPKYPRLAPDLEEPDFEGHQRWFLYCHHPECRSLVAIVRDRGCDVKVSAYGRPEYRWEGTYPDFDTAVAMIGLRGVHCAWSGHGGPVPVR